MLLKRLTVAATLLHYTTAAPINASCPLPYGLILPETYPAPTLCNTTFPTHFSLHGYALDGTITNASYIAPGVPHERYTSVLVQDFDTYGSYAFSIGNQSHLFSTNNGNIAYLNSLLSLVDFGGPIGFDSVNFGPWSAYWSLQVPGEPRWPIPTCSIIPAWNVLQCNMNGTALTFAHCNGNGFVDDVVWGTNVTGDPACKEVAIRVEQVPKDYGNSVVGTYCEKHPYDCPIPEN